MGTWLYFELIFLNINTGSKSLNAKIRSKPSATRLDARVALVFVVLDNLNSQKKSFTMVMSKKLREWLTGSPDVDNGMWFRLFGGMERSNGGWIGGFGDWIGCSGRGDVVVGVERDLPSCILEWT